MHIIVNDPPPFVCMSSAANMSINFPGQFLFIRGAFWTTVTGGYPFMRSHIFAMQNLFGKVSEELGVL